MKLPKIINFLIVIIPLFVLSIYTALDPPLMHTSGFIVLLIVIVAVFSVDDHPPYA